jgi:hypothetical protein
MGICIAIYMVIKSKVRSAPLSPYKSLSELAMTKYGINLLSIKYNEQYGRFSMKYSAQSHGFNFNYAFLIFWLFVFLKKACTDVDEMERSEEELMEGYIPQILMNVDFNEFFNTPRFADVINTGQDSTAFKLKKYLQVLKK